MYYSQRHDEILEILKSRNHVTVHYLAEQLHVSEPTIRRDLSVLEKNKRIRRTFGGAAIHDLITDEVPLELRQTQSLEAKEKIARQALRHIQDGQILFFGCFLHGTVYGKAPEAVSGSGGNHQQPEGLHHAGGREYPFLLYRRRAAG